MCVLGHGVSLSDSAGSNRVCASRSLDALSQFGSLIVHSGHGT